MVNLIRHGRWFDQLLKSGRTSGVHTRLDRPRDITELWVLGENRPGLFADLSRAISACGAQVMGARLHTGETGRIMDVFYLQNAEYLAFGRKNPTLLKQLKSRTELALNDELDDFKLKAPKPSRRAAAIPIEPEVRILETNRDDIMIIEIECRDRKGLLADLAQVLRREALDVLSAHIEVVGTRAIDAFYVSPRSNVTLTPRKKQQIIDELLGVLDPVEAESAA